MSCSARFQSFKVSKFDFVEPFAHSLKFEPFRRSNIGSSSMSCSARVHHLFLVLVMWAEISADITGRNFGWLYDFLRKLPCNFVKRNETITLTITLTSWKMSGTCPCGTVRSECATLKQTYCEFSMANTIVIS